MTNTASLITAAIKQFGTEAALGQAIGRSQNAVWSAKRHGRVSADMAKRIHEATGGKIPKWELRPDLWDAPAAPLQPVASEARA